MSSARLGFGPLVDIVIRRTNADNWVNFLSRLQLAEAQGYRQPYAPSLQGNRSHAPGKEMVWIYMAEVRG